MTTQKKMSNFYAFSEKEISPDIEDGTFFLYKYYILKHNVKKKRFYHITVSTAYFK